MSSLINGVGALDEAVLDDLPLESRTKQSTTDSFDSSTFATDEGAQAFSASKLFDWSAVATTTDRNVALNVPRDELTTIVQSFRRESMAATVLAKPVTPTAEQAAEASIKQAFASKFSGLATDKAAFHQMMRDVYGDNYDAEAAEGFRQAALRGDFSWLPEIKFESDATLQGANGAYDSASNVVYLNEKLMGNTSLASEVYLEETGHFLDTKLNKVDTAGDEGEMFRRLTMGENLSAVDRAAIDAEDDHGTITVDGKEVAVEFWNPFKAVANAVGTVAGAAVDAVVGGVKNAVESVTDIGRGVVDIFKGNFVEGFKKILFSPFKLMIQTPVDQILLVGAKTISAIQTLIGVETEGRKLTSAEITSLKAVYGDSIDYSKVTIKEGDVGLLGIGGRTRTVGNTIYVAKDNLPLTDALVTHEMAHVWQFQNGGTDYMSESIWAQAVGDDYDFEKGIKDGKAFRDLNPEQQAELIEQAFRTGFFNGTGKSFIYNGTDYTDYLTEAMKQVRNGDGAP